MTAERELLFVSPRFLFPTDSGGKIRTTQILRGLQGGAFRVTLVMPATEREREDWQDAIDSICDRLIAWQPAAAPRWLARLRRAASVAHRYPVSVASDRDAAGAATVREAMRGSPDVAVFDFPHSAVLAPEHLDVPSVMFTHNIEAEIFKRHREVAAGPLHRWLWRNQYAKMSTYERQTLRRFDMNIAVSDRDCEFFRDVYGVSACRAIPTGVDTDYFGFAAPESERQVVFCGSMDWLANVDGMEYFLRQVWPRVRAEVPDARMRVVGRRPPESLVARARREAPEWEFSGFVDDVREHVRGAAAFVIPLRVGGGTRIKAFEAMAMGVPVVSTSIGIEGLPVEHGEHFLRADEPGAMAESVVRLLREPALRSRIAGNARALVERNHGFRNVARVFETICLETVSNRAPS